MGRAADLKIKKPHLGYLREPTNFNTSVCKRAKSRPAPPTLYSVFYPKFCVFLFNLFILFYFLSFKFLLTWIG
jgi:hypothetical protein